MNAKVLKNVMFPEYLKNEELDPNDYATFITKGYTYLGGRRSNSRAYLLKKEYLEKCKNLRGSFMTKQLEYFSILIYDLEEKDLKLRNISNTLYSKQCENAKYRRLAEGLKEVITSVQEMDFEELD